MISADRLENFERKRVFPMLLLQITNLLDYIIFDL
jgi:hypothetical protein